MTQDTNRAPSFDPSILLFSSFPECHPDNASDAGDACDVALVLWHAGLWGRGKGSAPSVVGGFSIP